MDNVVQNDVVGNEEFNPVFVGAHVDVPVEAEANVVPAPKVDRRKGSRKTILPDGTVSYGFKADGTPRSAPGRKKSAG